jgi:hypothetical protein
MVVLALVAIASGGAEALNWVTVKTRAPRHLASPFDGDVYVSDVQGAATGYVSARGSLYSPKAVGDAQLSPNKYEISCFRREEGNSACYVASASIRDGVVKVDLSILERIQWMSQRVVAEDDSATCVTQRWEFDLVARRASFHKTGKVGADPRLCGDSSKATFMAVLGAVQWVGR